MINEGPLVDSYGRRITYLRVSLTDRCNFRCLYCVPEEGVNLIDSSDFLTREEIVRLIELAARLGIRRVRLTGGEPLLRRDILEIVRSIKNLNAIQELSITTNGSLLADMAAPLKAAGLDRINVSFDSMDPIAFTLITASNDFEKVRQGIVRALDEGFPVKINVVVMKGLSSVEITRFVEWAKRYPVEVRFLEYMPLCGEGWQSRLFIPIREVRRIVQENFELVPSASPVDGVAHVFELADGRGKVGFIGSLTESFCDRCSRIRVTASGDIFPCLFSNVRVSVGELLKRNAPDHELTAALREAVRIKPRGNRFRDQPYLSGSAPELNGNETPLIRKLGG